MSRVARGMFAILLVVGVRPSAFGQQVLDPDFNTDVERPAYTDRHPRVLFDEAHKNYHTASGRYRPFAALVTSDGYNITPNAKKFTKESLKGYEVLIIANAQGAEAGAGAGALADPAFEAAENDAVRDWVQAGGGLLLITDSQPWGAAAAALGSRLGVDMGKSTTKDPDHQMRGFTAPLVFSRDNGLLGNHPILRGRDAFPHERIERVLTFTGQSLQGPGGSFALLKFADTANDQPAPGTSGRTGSAAGRAQGVAFTLGKGRVVVLGEAGMLTAQLLGRNRAPMGMNAPDCDNRQLALNIMHWLSALKALDAATGVVRAAPASAPPASARASATAKARATTATRSTATPPAASARTPATAAAAPAPGRPLSTAEIAAESEASVALVSGEDGSGTGFLVRPGLLVTNAHVIGDEYMPRVKVRFPSAETAQQGPMPADLVYEDVRRDIAVLAVKSPLPPLRIAPVYTFRKGEDIVAIGNPGAGGKLTLENAITRGIMSTKTNLNGYPFYQLGIAVNPGNSGGPVFDSTGAVIGVVTRKSAEKEALAFCIPVEDLNQAIEKAATSAPAAIDRVRSRHRLTAAVKELGGGGALYSIAITFLRRPATGPQGKVNLKNKRAVQFFDENVIRFESRYLQNLRSELARVRNDPLVDPALRGKVAELSANFDKYKALYDAKGRSPGGDDPFPALKATHRRLLNDLFETLAVERPEYMFVFNLVPANSARGQNPGAGGAKD